jgi:hypothetical protein
MTQTERIRQHLLARKSITPLQALKRYGCFRLAARICELRKEGLAVRNIPTRTPGGAIVAKYVVD